MARSRDRIATGPVRLRVAIYARRSDESGTRDRSLPEQVAACRAWAEERGHEVVRVYEEVGSGVTGSTRAVFQGMISDAQRSPRPFDLVVVLDLSRFGRADVDETGYYRHLLRLAGVEVAYVLDGDKMTGDVGEIVGSVLQVGVRDQSRKNGYKVAAAHMACIERGVLPGGRRPYGYRLVRRPDWEKAQRKDTTLEIDADEARIVRRIFDDYVNGLSPSVIAGALNEAGISSPGGRKWWRTTVAEILSNPAYVGDLVRNQRRRGNTVPKSQAHFYHLGVKPVPATQDPEPIVRRDVFVAIIGREQWDRVQARLDARATTPTGGKPHLLAGLLRCGACGGPMATISGRTTKRGRARYYGCARAKLTGTARNRGRCRLTHVRGDRLEPEVLRVVREAAARLDPAVIAAELRKSLPGTPFADQKRLEQRLQHLEERRDALLVSTNTSEFVAAGLKKLEDEHARLRAQLDAVRAADWDAADVDRVAAAAVAAAQRLEAPDTEEGREALREVLGVFLRQVEVAPGEPRGPRAVRLDLYTPSAVGRIATRQELWSTCRVAIPDLIDLSGEGIVVSVRLVV